MKIIYNNKNNGLKFYQRYIAVTLLNILSVIFLLLQNLLL